MVDPVEIQVAHIERGVQGVGEIDVSIAPHHDVVGRIEPFAFEPVDKDLDPPFAVGPGDPPGLVFARVQASLPIHRVAVGPVGAFPIDFGRLSRNVFVDPVLTVVAEEEKPFARPHRPFAAFEAGGHLLHLQLREVLGGQGCRNREQEDDGSDHEMSSKNSPFFHMFGAIMRVMVETFAQDVRHTLRLMRREPAFTFTALATLALGIGLNTAIFSVAYGVLWRPLPYPNPDRLVIVSSAQQTERGVRTFSTWAPMSYEALRPRVTALDHLAAYSSIDAQLTGRGEPLQLRALDVSPNFFATLGVTPARGRAFLTGALASDDDRSAIVSDRLWRTSLNADPAIVGQSITIDGVPRTVVGVLPPDFSFRPVVGNGALALPEAEIFLLNRWPGDTGKNAFSSCWAA